MLVLSVLLGLASSCTVQDGALGLGRASLALVEGSLEQCVQDHIDSSGGDPLAVTSLSCPVEPPSSCAGIPSPELAGLAPLIRLRELDLTGRCVADLTPIALLERLERLELAHNAVVELRPLGTLKKLVYLGLADNPYEGALGKVRREPFSQLPELRELVLDGTDVGNILALAQAPKLEELSLRRTFPITNLQSLAALRGLRSLHIDGTEVSNLAALAELTELEELSADGTFVSSVEPLRALVAQHRLRRVSLRGTCVSSCDALRGAATDCSEPREPSSCYVPEEVRPVFASQLAVPVPMVERFAPDDLPIWSSDQLGRAFAAASQDPNIDWKDASGNCDGRALATLALFRGAGFPEATTVVSFGNLRPLSDDAPFGYYWFNYHIAVAVRAQAGAGAAYFVIDPALDPDAPMPVSDWLLRQIDSAGSSLDFSCEPYREQYRIVQCIDEVDAAGNFVVDSPSLLRGVVCPDANCAPS